MPAPTLCARRLVQKGVGEPHMFLLTRASWAEPTGSVYCFGIGLCFINTPCNFFISSFPRVSVYLRVGVPSLPTNYLMVGYFTPDRVTTPIYFRAWHWVWSCLGCGTSVMTCFYRQLRFVRFKFQEFSKCFRS